MFLDGLEIPGNAEKPATFHRNGGNFGPEWVATFKRNGGSFAPDYALIVHMMERNKEQQLPIKQ